MVVVRFQEADGNRKVVLRDSVTSTHAPIDSEPKRIPEHHKYRILLKWVLNMITNMPSSIVDDSDS